MAVKIAPDIFRQIISKDNRHNLDILERFMNIVIGDHVRDLALGMTAGMDDWVYKYIVVPDNEEFKLTPDSPYAGRAILLAADLKNMLGESFASDIPFDGTVENAALDTARIDLAGWCKLIRFRFLSKEHLSDFLTGESRELLDPFVRLLSKISWLRNLTAHEKEETVRIYENRRVFIRELDDFIRLFGQSEACAREALREGERLSGILGEMKEKTAEFKAMYELSVDKSPMDKRSKETYPAEYLYGYDRVYLAYPGCRNRDYARFVTGALNPIMIIGRSNLAVDIGTVEYLAELSESRDPSQALEAKKLYKEFNNSLKDTLSLIRTDDSGESLNYADAFLDRLERSDESICVLTDDEYVCRRISRMPDNIIAVSVTDAEHVMPYAEKLGSVPRGQEKVSSKAPAEGAVLIPGRHASVFYGDPDNNVKYTVGKCIGEGGEGNIYRTDIGKECFKIYHDHKLTRQRQEKVLAMISNKALSSDRRICWPIQPVFESSSRHELVGFSMKDVTYAAGSEAVALDDMIISLNGGDRLHWGWKRSDLVELCMNIAEIISLLHSQNVLIGDINPKNFLVDREGEVFLIDTDSCQMEGYVCPVGIPEYSSPALWEHDCVFAETPRTLQDEHFAMARLFYFVLFLGGSPYRFENNRIDLGSLKDCIMNKKFIQENAPEDDHTWWNLSAEVRDNFKNVFSSDRYPDERQWLNALYGMHEAIQSGRLSDDLKPHDAILLPGEKWQDKNCQRCGRPFKTAHNVAEELCPDCRELYRHNISRIMRVRCSRCGRTFITNLWELAELNHFRSADTIICPDCDGRVKTIWNETDKRKQIDSLLHDIDKLIAGRRNDDGSDQTGWIRPDDK